MLWEYFEARLEQELKNCGTSTDFESFIEKLESCQEIIEDIRRKALKEMKGE